MNKNNQKQQNKYIAGLIFKSSFDKDGNLSKSLFNNILIKVKSSQYFSKGLLRQLKELFNRYYDENKVIVISSIDLDKTERQKFIKLFKNEIEFNTDKDIIAGNIVKVGWDTYDSSVRGKLNQLLT